MAESEEAIWEKLDGPLTTGERIRLLRERAGLSLVGLSARIDSLGLGLRIDPTLLGKIEQFGSGSRTARRPNVLQLGVIAMALRVGVRDLASEKEFPHMRFLNEQMLTKKLSIDGTKARKLSAPQAAAA